MSVKIPCAYKKGTKKHIWIDQANSGLKGYECIACGSELMAKKYTERDEHFAHYKGSLEKCKISYWVSIRDIVLQEFNKFESIAVPGIGFVGSELTILSIQNISHEQSSDLTLHTNIGKIHIIICTPEHSVNRKTIRQSKSFISGRYLVIDISSLEDNHKCISEYTIKLLVSSITYKTWLMPSLTVSSHKAIIMHDDFSDEVHSRYLQSQINKVPSWVQYKKILVSDIVLCLGLSDIELSDKDISTCLDLAKRTYETYVEYYAKGKHCMSTEENFYRYYKNGNIFAYVYMGYIKFFAKIGNSYYAYTFYNGELYYLYNRREFLNMVFSLENNVNYSNNHARKIINEAENVF